MKIALVNYRFFISGGPERYLFSVKSALEDAGHQVFPYSVSSERNEPCFTKEFFLSPVGSGTETYFSEYKLKHLPTFFKVFGRMFYSFEAKRSFKKFLEEFKPDLIYILHYQNKISMSIIDSANSLDIPVIQRISDFGHFCVTGHLYDNKRHLVCEKCISGTKLQALRGCTGTTLSMSIMKVASLYLQQFFGVKKKIQAFIFPSDSTMQLFIRAGFDASKLHHVPTFYNRKLNSVPDQIQYQDFALYIGRLTREKGLETLIQAFLISQKKLYIIGFGTLDYEKRLKTMCEGKPHQIEFLGQKSFPEIKPYLSRCLFTVIPSEWYDNFPNTALESFAFSKCVVASNLGSLSELITHDYNGKLFEPGNPESLANQVESLMNDKELAIKMGGNASSLISTAYSAERHIDTLTTIFETVCHKEK